MGVFTRHVQSLNGGESVTIKAPANCKGIERLYITSTNLTYATVQTAQYLNTVQKSANTNYQEGYWPIGQEAPETTITIFGPGSAESVTIVIEWK